MRDDVFGNDSNLSPLPIPTTELLFSEVFGHRPLILSKPGLKIRH